MVNDPSGLTAALYADSAGAVGALVGSVGPTGAFDATTALAGQPQIACSTGTLVLGGNVAGAHSVALFGPGGWQFSGTGGTVPAFGMWEQDPTRCFTNGPVPS